MKELLLLFLLLTITQTYANPWSVSETSPVIEELFQRDPSADVIRMTQKMTAFWDQRFDHGYYFYQKILSPADGTRCEMHPTCTDYGYQAIRKHGPILGGWMAADRWMRDNGYSDEFYSLIEKFEKTKLSDPLSENDFWFHK